MKILIISQHLFPIQTPRSLRTTELIKELSKQGHQVTVYAVLGNYDYSDFEKKHSLTIKNIGLKAQITPYTSDGNGTRSFIDKVLGRLFGKILEFPNIEFLYSVPRIIKHSEKSDLLISIADPHHIHWGVSKAKRKYPEKFPSIWLADCGDPFMENGNTKSHYNYFSKFEKDFCKSCNFIIVPHKNAIDGYYAEYRDKIKIIPQGFEFNLIPSKNNIIESKTITFAYAGVFLKDIRNPSLFLKYLTKIKFDFKFIVYTPFRELVLPYQKILKNKLEIRDTINRTDLLEELKKMDFLLNIENLNTPTALPSKLIDYAITGRPILSINPDHVDTEKINAFLKRDYSKRFIIDNVDQYNISNVAKRFLNLSQNQII